MKFTDFFRPKKATAKLTASVGPNHVYDQDGLRSVHNHEFMGDPDFISAYDRGVEATRGRDYSWHWRVHVGIWASQVAKVVSFRSIAASSCARIDFGFCPLPYI